MRKLLTTLILATAWNTACAQPQTLHKPVICDDRERVFKHILGDLRETPQWAGSSPNSETNVVLTVNLKTGSWTLIEYNAVTACVLARGENSTGLQGTSVEFKSTLGS